MSSKNQQPLLTPAQAAEELGYSTGTLAQWRSLGINLKYRKKGNHKQAHIRYEWAEIERYKQSMKEFKPTA